MAAIAVTRSDLTAIELRAAAGREKDSAASRRMLALAMVFDGADRTSAAEICGMDRQTLRDWVHRYNATGLAGLRNLKSSGRPPKLTAAQKAVLVELVEKGPDPARHKVVRWRRCDLVASGVWPLLDEFDENRFLSGRQFGGPAAGLTIAQTREARRVVTMHPVAQGLAIHAAGLGCARAVSPVENHCKRQQPPRRRAVLLATGRRAKLYGRQIAPGDCNRRHRSRSPSHEELIDSDF